MKSLKSIVAGLGCLAVACVLSGCASTGYQKADKTGESIAQFHTEVVVLKKAVDAAMEGLSQITETAATDPRKAFTTYSAAVDRVADAKARCAKRAAAIKAQGEAYFKQWTTQLSTIKDPEIRKVAHERKAQLDETFSKIGPALQQAKTDFEPFETNLRDLRTLLSQDLTVAGVDAARPIITKTHDSGVKVESALTSLLAEMNSISATLTPSRQAKK